MAFSLGVEMLNIRMRKRSGKAVQLNAARIPGSAAPTGAGHGAQVEADQQVHRAAAARLGEAGLAGERQLRVVDFGAGKGYLTFAVALLLAGQGRADLLGVELRAELVAQGRDLARQFGMRAWPSLQGDVGHRGAGAWI
jgi:protein-L-isoaspartate O-methyltransferase